MNKENAKVKRNQMKPGFIETEKKIFEWDWEGNEGGI